MGLDEVMFELFDEEFILFTLICLNFSSLVSEIEVLLIKGVFSTFLFL